MLGHHAEDRFKTTLMRIVFTTTSGIHFVSACPYLKLGLNGMRCPRPNSTAHRRLIKIRKFLMPFSEARADRICLNIDRLNIFSRKRNCE
jgi:hypothetical protein